jgi:hypothetical protein
MGEHTKELLKVLLTYVITGVFLLIIGICTYFIVRALNEQPEPVVVEKKVEVEEPKEEGPTGVVNYTGSIGKYSIVMTLDYDNNTGTYYYTRQGAHNKLYLTIERNGNEFEINETTSDGQQSGQFSATYDPDTKGLSGTFYATMSGKSYDVVLNASN